MKRIRLDLLIVALVAVGSVILASGCGLPTCKEAMNHIYDKGCAIFVDGEQVSVSDAVAGCEDNKDLSKECGCTAKFNSTLECLDGIGDDCDKCDNKWEEWVACLTTKCG